MEWTQMLRGWMTRWSRLLGQRDEATKGERPDRMEIKAKHSLPWHVIFGGGWGVLFFKCWF